MMAGADVSRRQAPRGGPSPPRGIAPRSAPQAPGMTFRVCGLFPFVSQGSWVLVAAIVVATAFGLFRAARDGRFRGTHRLAVPESVREESDVLDGLEAELVERVTLLQFSSAFCAPCRTTRRVLGEVAGLVPGVRHVEVDAEKHLDVVRRLGITRTPTTLVLDAQGREVTRASGAPKRDEVLATLTRVMG